jgi:hypothetical protein
MKTKSVLTILICLFAFDLSAHTKVARIESIEQKIFQLVNQEREQRGLSSFKWNAKLGQAAAGHLAWMVERKTLGHHFSGEELLGKRIAATGVRFNASAENVAFATDWEDIHTSLMQSPGHRANILNPDYNELGIAVALGPNGYYAVQNFAHTTSESGSDDAEVRLAKAMRKELRRDLAVSFSPKVRETVCGMAEQDHLQASKLGGEPPLRRMFAYTTAEPEEVPDSFVRAAKSTNAARLVVGVCYKATERYPGGTYWVGIIY